MLCPPAAEDIRPDVLFWGLSGERSRRREAAEAREAGTTNPWRKFCENYFFGPKKNDSSANAVEFF